MQVIRERPCQRRHHRVTAPLRVTLENGAHYTSSDWSLGGLRIDGCTPAPAALDEVVKLHIELPFQGFEIGFEVSAKIARVMEADQTVCFSFDTLDERARDILTHFIDDLIRGKMATIDDTICRIDVPVTPISTNPDPNPTQELSVQRWPIKTIVMSGIYACLGVLVFGYIALLLYSRTTQLEVPTAVVSAPLQVLRMPVDGVLRPVHFTEGDKIRAGEAMATIHDHALQARIENAQIKLEETRKKLWRAEQKFKIERERIKLYQIISRTDQDVAAARVAAAKEALSAADENRKRIQSLAKTGNTTRTQEDEAAQRQLMAQAHLREAELSLEKATAMNSVSARRHYNHKEFVSDLDVMALEVDELRGDYETASKQLEALVAVKQNLIIRAPFDGRVARLIQTGGTNLLRNEPFIVVEKEVPTTVKAFLRQDEALQLRLNDKAMVFLPALGRHVSATIVGIDQSSAFLDQKTAQYGWRNAEDRTSTVSLRLADPTSDEKVAVEGKITAGLPAVVIFTRRGTNAALSRAALSL